MKSAVDIEEKLLDLMDDMSIVEGACSLQKEWFEHIIKEHWENKKDFESVLNDGVELMKQINFGSQESCYYFSQKFGLNCIM